MKNIIIIYAEEELSDFFKGRHHNRNKKRNGEGTNGNRSQSKIKETDMYGEGIFLLWKINFSIKVHLLLLQALSEVT